MKKIALPLLVFILSLFIIPLSYAQTWKWAVGGRCPHGGMEAWPIAVDKSGNVYEGIIYLNLASHDTTISADSLTSYFGNDSVKGIWGNVLVTTDSTGNYRWIMFSRNWTITDIVGCANDGICVFGTFFGKLKLGTDSLVDVGGLSRSGFCARISSSGHVKWLRKIADSATCTGSVDSAGNVYVGGGYKASHITLGSTTITNAHSNKHTDAYVAKFDSLGNPVWLKGFGSDSSEAVTCVSATGSGDVYVAGSYKSPHVSIESTALTNSMYTQYPYYFLAKFDKDGVFKWADSGAVDNMGYLADMKTDNIGNTYMTGAYINHLRFGSVSLPFYAYNNVFLTKHDKNGHVSWSKVIPFELAAYCLATDICGSIWVAGQSFVGYENSFIFRYDSLGSRMDSMVIPCGGDDELDIVADNRGHLYAGGDYFMQTIIGADTLFIDSTSEEVSFIAKYSYPLCPEALSVEALPLTSKITASLFPNPATGECTVATTSTSVILSKLQIFDITGRQLDEYLLNAKEYTFNAGRLKPGIYACRITFSDQTTIIEKLVVSQ